nr:GNAT family N-acetyltransferase [Mycolicibacterium conceptionense]
MTPDSLKSDLHRYLKEARAALIWKLDGLSDYHVRRPLTAHGTNLLGLVKHLTGCEIGYFGYVFDRPFPDPPRWLSDTEDPTVDMWATAAESRVQIVDRYRQACAHSDTTIAALGLEHEGVVPGWPEERRHVTLHHVLVHMLAETSRHAGHADILRETVDDRAGLHAGRTGLPTDDAGYWLALRRRIEHAARSAAGPGPAVSVRQMTDDEYAVATATRQAASVEELARHMPEAQARERFDRTTAALLPQRQHTPGHQLVTALDDTATAVGYAWLGPDPRQSAGTVWLYDIHVFETARGRGYGRALLAAVEGLARDGGAETLALNVNSTNRRAVDLYRAAGYRSESSFLSKRLRGQ